MLVTDLFSKTAKEFPKDEESLNAKFLIKAGFIRKLSSGVYSYLPLGLKVIKKIEQIVREEMNVLPSEELLMPSLITKSIWEKSGRWDVDVVYKINEDGVGEFGLGWTHEEVITDIATHFIFSYEDLPKSVYQIQTKFRREPRAKSGLLRGREFIMKDLYSFHKSEEDLNSYYQKIIDSYSKVFKRLDLDAKVVTAGGGLFTKNTTHEFQVFAESGEDIIFYCSECDFAVNKEIAKNEKGDKCPNCTDGEIEVKNAIEVANVFRQGTKYSEAFGLNFKDSDGVSKPVWHGSYGIGISRIMGTLAEIKNDKNGIIWPDSVSPFKVYLIDLNGESSDKCDKLYKALQENALEVIYDKRNNVSAGEKFANADLLGIPWRAVMSKKTGDKVEIKKRTGDEVKIVDVNEFIQILKG